jgi:hypothetical protein
MPEHRLAPVLKQEATMQEAIPKLYRSTNGDWWSLIRDERMGRVMVLHEPNAASGG